MKQNKINGFELGFGLEKGEVLAFKTDTVWGFGADPDDIAAIKKIYEIKKRDEKKPLILMSHDFKYLEKYIEYIPNYAYGLIEKYLPGGLTLIFQKSKLVNSYITPYSTVGVRVPNSIDFFEISKNIQTHTLATTSCNISTEPPVRNYQEAMEKFKDVATIIKPIDEGGGGDNINNLPSTVILCENENYKVLRQGAIEL